MGGQRRQKRKASRSVTSILRPLNSLKISQRWRLLNSPKVSKHFQAPGPLMLLMRAWGSRAGPADAHDARPLGASVATQKNPNKKPFTGGTRGSAALASGLILLRRRQASYCRDDPAKRFAPGRKGQGAARF